MLQQFKILLLALIFHIVRSNYEGYEIDSTTSHEICTEPDKTASDSNCYCYSQPETDFEYSICSPKKCQKYKHNCKDPGYFMVHGKCFYFEKDGKNFKDAKENCKCKGGKLYEPKGMAKIKEDLTNSGPGTWAVIGITDIPGEGNWAYDSNGQNINFSPTFMGQNQQITKGLKNRCMIVLMFLLHTISGFLEKL